MSSIETDIRGAADLPWLQQSWLLSSLASQLLDGQYANMQSIDYKSNIPLLPMPTTDLGVAICDERRLMACDWSNCLSL